MMKNKQALLRKGLLLIVTLIGVSCASNKLEQLAAQKNLKASYFIWHSGSAPAGTGINCQVSFYNPKLEFSVDSFEVNNQIMETEITWANDTSTIIGTYYVGPDFEKINDEVPEYFRNQTFSGKLRLFNEQLSHWITIDQFEKTEPQYMPM